MQTTQKIFVHGDYFYTVFAWGEIIIQRRGSDDEPSSIRGYSQLPDAIQAKVKEVIKRCEFNEANFI